MAVKNSVRLTIDWRAADSNMPEAQKEAVTQAVFRELRSHPTVQTINRVPDPNVPTGSMGAQWLWNILTAEIPGDGLREACQEALDQLEGKPMTFKLEAGDKTIEVKDVNPQNFDKVVDKLVQAVKEMDSNNSPGSS